ncbi:glycosyltransferase [Antarcticibacterium flavum]|uniref:Glycosyltransferase n=1 Tax=Antarcticibacterium flavum TaxID=2058175 RepID=A0A5B7X3K6_9FLAO|nr:MULTISPECIES: TIGR04282 family arsenosugar biosynthesis glycosyltransferase [Antarcticibacterium]MCM4161462.1 glycosyltransferase [Antarcticibacterium sp. W02-3]QCY69302.1 glycosyltransferase [Antarcticibacterium flavum]
MASQLLIIFIRNLQPGRVKTRLAADVGHEAAMDIYKFLLQHTHGITKDLPYDKVVYYSENLQQNDIWEEEAFQKKVQRGKDLGDRMQQAFQEAFSSGYEQVVIVGSDIYELSSEEIKQAFSSLKENDYVLGPAKDGGYYLLGMTKPTLKVFKNKFWSTSSVLEDTLTDLKNEQVFLLKELNDVDTFEDIKEHRDFQKFFQHLKK